MLIHAAARGSGSAAIQLAVNAGARVFATAGTEAKLALCREFGADVAINYLASDFAQIVMEKTGNRGVDVVFDNVGEAVMEKPLSCLACNGRYRMMGFASNEAVADEKFLVSRRLMTANMKLCGVLLAYASEAAARMLKKGMGWNFVPDALGARITRDIVAQVVAQKVKPLVGRVVAFEEIPAAMEAMRSRQTLGRTIVRLYRGALRIRRKRLALDGHGVQDADVVSEPRPRTKPPGDRRCPRPETADASGALHSWRSSSPS